MNLDSAYFNINCSILQKISREKHNIVKAMKFYVNEIIHKMDTSGQGFSTFWYPRTPKSTFSHSAYPKIRVGSPLRTPKSEILVILPKWVSFGCFFFILHTFCEILLSVFLFCVPPVSFSRTPRGTRTPGWEPLPQDIMKHNMIIWEQRKTGNITEW